MSMHFNAIFNLNTLLRQCQWNLLDFGPAIELKSITVKDFNNATPIDAFLAFISDVGIEALKRNRLCIFGVADSQALDMIFRAKIDVFLAATQPLKLFQEIEFYLHLYDETKSLIKRIKEEKVLKLMPPEIDRWGSPMKVFRMSHPKLNMALDVKFSNYQVYFNLVYLRSKK